MAVKDSKRPGGIWAQKCMVYFGCFPSTGAVYGLPSRPHTDGLSHTLPWPDSPSLSLAACGLFEVKAGLDSHTGTVVSIQENICGMSKSMTSTQPTWNERGSRTRELRASGGVKASCGAVSKGGRAASGDFPELSDFCKNSGPASIRSKHF